MILVTLENIIEYFSTVKSHLEKNAKAKTKMILIARSLYFRYA